MWHAEGLAQPKVWPVDTGNEGRDCAPDTSETSICSFASPAGEEGARTGWWLVDEMAETVLLFGKSQSESQASV